MNRVSRERLINNIVYKLAKDGSVGHLVGVNKEVSKPMFKNKLKGVLKRFVNGADFALFVDSYKRGDRVGMKKALPGMLKGVGKVLAVVGAVAGLGYYAKEHILHHAIEQATGMDLPKIPVKVLEASPQEVDKMVDQIFTPNLVENSPLLSTMESLPSQAEELQKQYEAFENLIPLNDTKAVLEKFQANPQWALDELYSMSRRAPSYYNEFMKQLSESEKGSRFIQNLYGLKNDSFTARPWIPSPMNFDTGLFDLWEHHLSDTDIINGLRERVPDATKSLELDYGIKYATSRVEVDNFIDNLAEIMQEGIVVESRKLLRKKMG